MTDNFHSTTQAFNAIIIGGGMVGAATAKGLADLGLQVLLLERDSLPAYDPNAPYDLRISAISAGSVALLQSLGAWQNVEKMRHCPYYRLETWETPGMGTYFDCADLGLPELGFMIENHVTQGAIWQTFAQCPTLNAMQNVKIQQIFRPTPNGDWCVQLENAQTFTSPLLIAADGANSLVRQTAGIGVTAWQYRQDCMLLTVKTNKPQHRATWQQFYPTGPRAFLPLTGHNACLVWYDSPQKIAELKKLSLAALSRAVMQAFPAQLGEVDVLNRTSFPLTRRHAQTYVKNGVVLLGDAAHTINPLAGQGVNLGFKDVKALLDVLKNAHAKGEDLASDAVLKRYERTRRADNLLMQSAIDFFYKGFKTPILPLKLLRNAALIGVDHCQPLKKRALKYALGL